MDKFHEKIETLKQHFCLNCNEMWPNTKEQCATCKKYKMAFTEANDMKPNLDDLPLEIKKLFEELTMVNIIFK